jgi:sugar phosphate isomerase/epimerase
LISTELRRSVLIFINPLNLDDAMRLGFYTVYSKAIAQFAQETGFRSLELSVWPQTSLNADTVKDEHIAEITEDLANRDIEISALGYYPNYLHPDPREAAEAKRYFHKVLELAQRIGVSTVCTFAGQIPGAAVQDSLEPFAQLFTEFCQRAEELGVRIAIENCPMLDHKTRAGENIAYSPEIWDAMFEAVPSPALGIELDPSHMVYLGIDYIRAVLDYGPRIFHVHAKDTDINTLERQRLGTFGSAFAPLEGFGNGWWRFRAPGFGEVNWTQFISALVEVGYLGNLDIEHEDEVFAAAALTHIDGEADIVEMLGREPNGLVLGYRHLAPLVPASDGTDLLPH